LLIVLYRWFPSTLQVLAIIRRETLIHWHRSGFLLLLALEFAIFRRPAAGRG
jgi:hypothetical protein